MAQGNTSNTPESPSRRPTVLARPSRWIFVGILLWVGSALAGGLAAAGLSSTQFTSSVQQTWVAYLAYIPATVLALLGVVMMLVGAIRWAMFGNDKAEGRDSSGALTRDEVSRLMELMESINRRLAMSDAGRRAAYRATDLEALRLAIRDEMSRSNFDAALALVETLGRGYGYLEEAEQYRDQIATARTVEQESKITRAIAQLDDLLSRHEFDRAARELARTRRLYPESDRVQQLAGRVNAAREQYKLDLERQFLNANERDDVDRAMELLKQLDRYLTAEEAEPLKEIARGVIGKKRDNLGVQFKIAVHDREWLRAIRVGEQIISDFPNTKMADEVRSRLDALRRRAAEQQAAR